MIVARKEWQFLVTLSWCVGRIRKDSGCILMKAQKLAQPRDAYPKRPIFDGRPKIRRKSMMIAVLEDSKGGPVIGFRIVDDLKRVPDDSPPLGLFFAVKKDASVVRYSVLHENEQIFASSTNWFFLRKRSYELNLIESEPSLRTS
jgi:hypothetical protein